jgi:hypothetical protein
MTLVGEAGGGHSGGDRLPTLEEEPSGADAVGNLQGVGARPVRSRKSRMRRNLLIPVASASSSRPMLGLGAVGKVLEREAKRAIVVCDPGSRA